MPKASEVAAELRKLADRLDGVDAEIEFPKVFLLIPHNGKESFKAMARIMPRPIKKGKQYEGTNFPETLLTYESDAIHLKASVPQALTCTLITPAQAAIYECDPILSPEEDAALEIAQ